MRFASAIAAYLSIGAFACPLGGCGGSSGTEASETPGEEASSFTITEVHIDESGKESVQVHAMTRDELVNHARAVTANPAGKMRLQSTAPQVACSENSVRLYDDTLENCRNRGCNEICFQRDNFSDPDMKVYLGNYCVTPGCNYSWNSMVRAYWTGWDTSSLLRDYPGYPRCTEILGAMSSYKYSDAGWCGQNSDYLVLQHYVIH